MKSPARLEYDIQMTDLSAAERAVFMGTVVEIKDDDVIVEFNGRRVLAHVSNLEKPLVN